MLKAKVIGDFSHLRTISFSVGVGLNNTLDAFGNINTVWGIANKSEVSSREDR